MCKLRVFFVSNGTNKIKTLVKPVKPITNATDLKKMFPDIDVDNLWFIGTSSFFKLIFLIRCELFIYPR